MTTRARQNCRNCRHWWTFNGLDGDCEHPSIRNKVICISTICIDNPQYTETVGYRTAPDFGCNMFENRIT